MDNRKKIGLIISCVVTLFIAALVLVNCFSSKERYFEDVTVGSNGMYRGTGELFELDGNKRYYKFVTYGGRLLSVSYHDYDNLLKPFENNAAKIEFKYNDDGDLVGMVKYDLDGKVVVREKITPKKKRQQ